MVFMFQVEQGGGAVSVSPSILSVTYQGFIWKLRGRFSLDSGPPDSKRFLNRYCDCELVRPLSIKNKLAGIYLEPRNQRGCRTSFSLSFSLSITVKQGELSEHP